MARKRYLVIDDDPVIREIISKAFKEEKLVEVLTAANGLLGMRAFYETQPDLVLLDIMMPEMDGWEVCRQIRMVSSTPVILLTSLSEEKNAIRGLDNGADDFLAKPFNLDHLKARIRAVMRRFEQRSPTNLNLTYADDDLQVDFDRHSVQVNGEPVELTRTEHILLEFLIRNRGRVLSYTDILTNVWGWEYQDSQDYAHVYVSHLRRKIEKPLEGVTYFQSVYGIGYKFERLVAAP